MTPLEPQNLSVYPLRVIRPQSGFPVVKAGERSEPNSRPPAEAASAQKGKVRNKFLPSYKHGYSASRMVGTSRVRLKQQQQQLVVRLITSW